MKVRFFMALMVAGLTLMPVMVKAAAGGDQRALAERSVFWAFNKRYPRLMPGITSLVAFYSLDRMGIGPKGILGGAVATCCVADQYLRDNTEANLGRVVLLTAGAGTPAVVADALKNSVKNTFAVRTTEIRFRAQLGLNNEIDWGVRSDSLKCTFNMSYSRHFRSDIHDVTIRVTHNTLLATILSPFLSPKIVNLGDV